MLVEPKYFDQVVAGDGLPSRVCRHCIHQLDRWYAFKQKCENSDAALRQFAVKPKPELVFVKVRITFLTCMSCYTKFVIHCKDLFKILCAINMLELQNCDSSIF
jgi:hypothetical protein